MPQLSTIRQESQASRTVFSGGKSSVATLLSLRQAGERGDAAGSRQLQGASANHSEALSMLSERPPGAGGAALLATHTASPHLCGHRAGGLPVMKTAMAPAAPAALHLGNDSGKPDRAPPGPSPRCFQGDAGNFAFRSGKVSEHHAAHYSFHSGFVVTNTEGQYTCPPKEGNGDKAGVLLLSGLQGAWRLPAQSRADGSAKINTAQQP